MGQSSRLAVVHLVDNRDRSDADVTVEFGFKGRPYTRYLQAGA